MSNGKKYIGFDLGAESGRCVVAILENGKLELNEVHRFATHNYKSGTEFHWDIKKIFSEIVTGLKKAKKKFGSKFESIGIDTWGVDYALVDENNELLNDPFHYRDDRTDKIMDEAFAIVSKEKIYSTTGIQFQPFNTIFQLLAEMKNDSEKLIRARKMILIPDYLNFLLSGEIKAEYTIASTTGLVDPARRDWAWELIDLFGIPRHIFPEIIEPGERLNNLLPTITKETGLNSDIPIIASAGHDTAAAVVSVPAEGNNWAFLSSGTWSLMGLEIGEPILKSEAMQYNFTNEGGVEKSIRFLKNIIGLWPIQECRRYWLKKGEDYTYPYLTEKATNIGNTNRWLNLNDVRFLKAGEMPEKISAFLNETNQNSADDIGSIIRIVLESLAFNYKKTIEEIEKVIGKRIEKLHAVGGGIQNELLSQLTADALCMEVIAGPIEGTIIGNIGIQAIATKDVENLSQWREVVKNSFSPKVYKPKNPMYFEENRDNFNTVC
ncbi:MAG: rhamnulokinase family protein [Bacteroidota bacterium]